MKRIANTAWLIGAALLLASCGLVPSKNCDREDGPLTLPVLM